MRTEPRRADRTRRPGSAASWCVGGTLPERRPRPALLARQRQLRRPRRGDRRPRPARRHGPGAAHDRGAAGSGADERDHRRRARRRSGSRPRPPNRPRSPSSSRNDLSSVDDVDLTAGQAGDGLRPARRRGQLRGQGQRRPAAARPAAPARPLEPCTWVGFPLAIAVALLVVPGRGARACATPAWCGRTTAARCSPSRSGRCWRRRRWSRWRRSPSSTTAPTSTCSSPNCGAGCPTCSGIAFLGFLDDALGRGEAADTPRGWRGHCAGAARRAASRPGRSRRSGRWRWPPTSSPGAGCESWRYLADVALLILATNLFNLLDLRPGRAEKALALLGAGPLPRRLDARAARAARDLRRAGPGRRLASPCASGRCSATPARTWSARSPGSGC